MAERINFITYIVLVLFEFTNNYYYYYIDIHLISILIVSALHN